MLRGKQQQRHRKKNKKKQQQHQQQGQFFPTQKNTGFIVHSENIVNIHKMLQHRNCIVYILSLGITLSQSVGGGGEDLV